MSLNFPSSPSVDDTYTVGARTWTWTGSIWELRSTTVGIGSISTTELSDSAVTTAKIATDAITAAKLAAGASNTYVLTADSSTTSGVKWAIIPASGGLSTTTEGAIMTMSIGG